MPNRLRVQPDGPIGSSATATTSSPEEDSLIEGRTQLGFDDEGRSTKKTCSTGGLRNGIQSLVGVVL
eukprot:4930112-Pyramimonas_sp.AAC.1